MNAAAWLAPGIKISGGTRLRVIPPKTVRASLSGGL